VLLLIAAGCMDAGDLSRVVHTDVFLQEPPAAADILWVIDDSLSMAQEQERLAEGFASFIGNIEATNIDFHLGVVTTDMDLDNPDRARLLGEPAYLTLEDDYEALFVERVQVGIDGSAREKGLQAAADALREPAASGVNAGFRRAGADLAVLFVSDEDDCSDAEALAADDDNACYTRYDELVPIPQLATDLWAVAGDTERLQVGAIVGPSREDACEGAHHGGRYLEMVNATGGVAGDICEADYGEMLDELGLAVAGVRRTFLLSWRPVEGSIEVSVGASAIPEDPSDGWVYDADQVALQFPGAYVPPRGSSVSVYYEIAGER